MNNLPLYKHPTLNAGHSSHQGVEMLAPRMIRGKCQNSRPRLGVSFPRLAYYVGHSTIDARGSAQLKVIDHQGQSVIPDRKVDALTD